MDIKVLLAIPPDYDHNYPPLGTPALAAFLKKNGVSCAQTDLNIEYRDFLAQKISGEFALSADEKRFFMKPAIGKFFSEKLHGRYYSEYLPRNNAGDLPYNNNTNSSFHFYERLISSGHLWRYLEDIDENTFAQFYKESGILERLRKSDVGLFGISVISPAQAIASLTLGLLVKKNLPHIHVTMGGQWVTLYRDAILRKRELFSCFDSLIVFEGETALYKLARALDEDRPIGRIQNIILKDTGKYSEGGRLEEDMDKLPCPDFDGLPLGRYDENSSGHPALTYETSRGCYWSRCAYCVDLPLPKPSYRRKNPRLVVDGMKELKAKYNTSYLLFGDPGLSPRQMREISQIMIAEGVEMELWTMARLDEGFNRELFDLAFRAGFRQINFGFESANDRVCASLDKGNFRERSARIIRDCAASGIRVDLQTILGLPGESFDEALDTIDFLVSNKNSISHVTFNTYYLTPFNYIHNNPDKYGIEFEKDPSLPFRFFIPFNDTRGLSSDQVSILQKIYYSMAGTTDDIVR